jgi:hypothetical protein
MLEKTLQVIKINIQNYDYSKELGNGFWKIHFSCDKQTSIRANSVFKVINIEYDSKGGIRTTL